jgi:S1-C subfamily serine protease
MGVMDMKRKSCIVSLFLIVLIIFSGCAPVQSSTVSSVFSIQTSTKGAALSSPQIPDAVSSLESTLESIYTKVNPSVVLIQVTLPASITNPGGGALGSGFIWDTQGDIVTNNHVISGASSTTVTFTDGTVVDATLVGADADSDLAVIKVDPNVLQLQPVSVADSTQVKVGQLAIAIGNPFGLENTMTSGFVSAIGRLVSSNVTGVGPTYSIPDIIQTDAAINPGNSGGVLLDDNGAVIGVTQSIESQSGSSSGVGFAIPSSIVKQVVPALIKTGHYDHPYLGLSVGTLDPNIAKAMNLPSNQRGALVESIISGGPADKAGIKASTTNFTDNGTPMTIGGDVIVTFNGQIIKNADDLVTFLADQTSVGQTVTLTILRNGNQVQVQVNLGVRPSS